MHKYEVTIEVEGPAAMFARPDTGGTPTSYPVPTWSACKGIFESIAFLSDGLAWINPVKVEVCRRVGQPGGRVNFHRYTTNYGGPERKTDLFRTGMASGGSSMQLFATILHSVCYRLHGQVLGTRRSPRDGTNVCHYLQALFIRRLHQGKCYRTPCLGWSEFTCSYWGPFREGLTEVDDALSLEIPSMLLCVWDRPTLSERYAPVYTQDASIIAGVLRYEPSHERLDDSDVKGMADAQ